jgi:DNA-directed RNA polymerase specialized sigma24 family protein
MSATNASGPQDRAAFELRLGELRPKLHRYCARMTGSVIDGEDVVQEALLKASCREGSAAVCFLSRVISFVQEKVVCGW